MLFLWKPVKQTCSPGVSKDTYLAINTFKAVRWGHANTNRLCVCHEVKKSGKDYSQIQGSRQIDNLEAKTMNYPQPVTVYSKICPRKIWHLHRIPEICLSYSCFFKTVIRKRQCETNSWGVGWKQITFFFLNSSQFALPPPYWYIVQTDSYL